jgi:hypothetical protein
MTDVLEEAGSRPSISVLMSTYAKEKASNLEAALESLWRQTELPDEVVLVLDGPVGADQEEVVARFAARGGLPELVVVRLEANQGLAKALNAGLERCRGTYIARMDSDDLCQPDRLTVQVAYAQRHPDTDVICSWSDEFFDDGTKSRLKVAPVGHDAIVRALNGATSSITQPSSSRPTACERSAGTGRSTGYWKTTTSSSGSPCTGPGFTSSRRCSSTSEAAWTRASGAEDCATAPTRCAFGPLVFEPASSAPANSYWSRVCTQPSGSCREAFASAFTPSPARRLRRETALQEQIKAIRGMMILRQQAEMKLKRLQQKAASGRTVLAQVTRPRSRAPGAPPYEDGAACLLAA